MAYPAGDVYHVMHGGAMYTDRWQIGLWVNVIGMSDNPSATQMNADAAAQAAAFANDVWNSGTGQSLKPLNTSAVTYDKCTNAMYRNGVLVQTGLANVTPVAGTGTTPHPPSVAIVATLRTGRAGRSYRGRIYLPATAIPIAGSNMQTSTTLATLVGNLKTYLDSINVASTSFPGVPTLRVGILSKTLGVITPITTVTYDSKLDVIRRRQDKIGAASTATATLA